MEADQNSTQPSQVAESVSTEQQIDSSNQTNSAIMPTLDQTDETAKATTFISQPQSTQQPKTRMTDEDDVYEFKSSPEDNAMLLNPDRSSSSNFAPFEKSRYGLDDEEADQMEGNLIVDEQMDVEEYGHDNKRRSAQRPSVPTFEIERCDDEELDETESNDGQSVDERRKVPPLRILLNKNGGDSSKNLSPSLSTSSGALDAQVDGTPTGGGIRKRAARKKAAGAGAAANEKRLTRLTRGQLLARKQPVPHSEGLSAKRPRATRRNIGASGPSSRALTPKREREVSQAPSTSSAVQADQTGVSMPPSPEANSQSSNLSDNDPAFNLQPERLSFQVTNLFNQSDLGAYTGLKRMLHQRWARDFQEQQQIWTPARCKSSLNQSTRPKVTKLINPKVPQPKPDIKSAELMQNQIIRQRRMRKKHFEERKQLAQFIEREFKRQLNDIPIRSKTAITCVRVLSDNDIYNGNVLDTNTDELNKIPARSRDEVVGQVRQKVEPLVNSLLKRHKIEADCLYFEQCAEWERFVTDQVPVDKRLEKFDDFTLRDCIKHLKPKQTILKEKLIRMPRVETIPYCKMALHAVKYPHFSVHGLLVGRIGENQEVEVKDAFPVFHNLVVSPPLEIALIYVDQYCQEHGFKLIGSYFANDGKDDESMDIMWAKPLHEKLVANGVSAPIVLRIDNDKLCLNSTESCLVAYTYDSAKWKTLSCKLANSDETLSIYTAALQLKLHRELVDFECHLEEPTTADFYNSKLSQKLLSLEQ
ncbi:MPN domain-containing protein [Aphelenchoides bicaudatus]|nr:MPN domain-containing protein [Aphelenchoides bicaudatus]